MLESCAYKIKTTRFREHGALVAMLIFTLAGVVCTPDANAQGMPGPPPVHAVVDTNGINLTDIEKRPSQKVNWEYYFFIDAQGHADDAAMKKAIEEAKAHCLQLTVLGSYPRAIDVL